MEIIDHEKRFVTMALDKCYITPRQFLEALRIQEDEIMDWQQYKDLSRIFIEQGFMDFSKVNEIFIEMQETSVDRKVIQFSNLND